MTNHRFSPLLQWMDVMTGIMAQQPHVSAQDKQLLAEHMQSAATFLGHVRVNGKWQLPPNIPWAEARDEEGGRDAQA